MLNTITNKMIIKQIFLATLLFSEKRITSGKKDTSQRNNEEFKDKFWTPNSIDLVKTTTEFDRYKIHQLNIVSRDQPAFPNDFHPEKDLTSLTLINDKGWTPITKAVATGQVDVIRKFLKSEEGRALLEVQDGGGWNAMTKAGSTGQVNVIREFLNSEEGRVLLTIQDGDGWNAMTMAGSTGQVNVIREFLNSEEGRVLLTIQDGDGWNTMTLAAEEGQVEVIREFLNSEEGRVLLTVQDKFGLNAMTRAGLKGQVNVIREFLNSEEGRVLLTIQDGGGRNAMTMAGLKGHIGVAVIPAIIGLLTTPTLQEQQHFVNSLNLLFNRLLRHVRHYISKIESLKI